MNLLDYANMMEKRAVDTAMLTGGLGGAGVGGLLSALLTTRSGDDDTDYNKRRIRNALLGALGGGAVGTLGGSIYNEMIDPANIQRREDMQILSDKARERSDALIHSLAEGERKLDEYGL